MSRLSLSEHTLNINLRAYDVDAFDFAEIEDYVRALTEGREYQFKEAYAKEHFISINRRLRDTQEVDLPEPFRDSVRQHYFFNLLRPSDYSGWFSRLKNGLAVVG